MTGKKTAEQARKAFGENVVQDALGNHPPYVTALQFEPAPSPADPDTPLMPAPQSGWPMMLHKAHGQHLADTMQLGLKIGVTPIETPL